MLKHDNNKNIKLTLAFFNNMCNNKYTIKLFTIHFIYY
jgi:hypothetical protein